MVTALNGWTAARLDDLAKDVEEIRQTLDRMQSEETETLRSRVHELERRPRAILLGIGAPVVAAAVTVVLSHAF